MLLKAMLTTFFMNVLLLVTELTSTGSLHLRQKSKSVSVLGFRID